MAWCRPGDIHKCASLGLDEFIQRLCACSYSLTVSSRNQNGRYLPCFGDVDWDCQCFLKNDRNSHLPLVPMIHCNLYLDQPITIYDARQFAGNAPFPTDSPTATRLGLCVNSLRPRQNGCHFADDIFKCIFLNEYVRSSIKMSMKFVPEDPINNIPALVQIMAWRRPGDKP